MARGKLILICQSGGEFVTNDDGSMSYNGGDAQALDMFHETTFDNLKLELAEMCKLEYRSLAIKYFLPGNRRTLITLSNDKDLKRMYDFHANSVTADIFVMGKPVFHGEALKIPSRGRGKKRVKMEVVIASPSTSLSPAVSTPRGIYATAVNSTVDPCFDTAKKSPEIDMNCTPADTVKKRRRTASSKIGASDSTIVTVTGNFDEKRRTKSRKKNNRNSHKEDQNASSNDVPPEKLIESWKEGITGEGQEFKSVYEFRDALQKYAIAHRFAYKLKKNDTNRAGGRCIAECCSWRIYASWDSSKRKFRIKNLTNSHTCEGESWKFAHPTKNWLVNIIKDRLRDDPNQKTKDIANGICQDFGVELNYSQVWRGIEDAREQLQGSYKEAYNQLPGFCKKMAEKNPGSFLKLFTRDDERRFKQLFVSFYASIYGFQTCRPLIFLDATSLKSKYHEVLLTATALDGDDGVLPVAFAIVDIESDENWHWFLEQFKSVVSHSRSITFVSDREKELKKMVVEVFENACHGYSMYYLLNSFKRSLRGPYHGDGKASLPINFMAAAHSIRFDGFKMHTENIKRVSTEAYNWVMQIEPEYFTSALFKGEHYNHITEDITGSYDKWIEETCELPITQKVEYISSKIIELIETRRADSSEWSTMLTPSKEETIREETIKACSLKVLFSSETLFEVHDDLINVVDIEKRDCSCLRWKQTGLPCCHVVAVLRCTGRNIYDHCSRYFTVDYFRLTYSKSINPVGYFSKTSKGKKIDLEATQILPPCTSRPSSEHREKKIRREEVVKRTVVCTKCKQAGHNKATCIKKDGVPRNAVVATAPNMKVEEGGEGIVVEASDDHKSGVAKYKSDHDDEDQVEPSNYKDGDKNKKKDSDNFGEDQGEPDVDEDWDKNKKKVSDSFDEDQEETDVDDGNKTKKTVLDSFLEDQGEANDDKDGDKNKKIVSDNFVEDQGEPNDNEDGDKNKIIVSDSFSEHQGEPNDDEDVDKNKNIASDSFDECQGQPDDDVDGGENKKKLSDNLVEDQGDPNDNEDRGENKEIVS